MSCQVCTDKFNKIRKQVKCSCDYECCVSCAKTYMLSKSQNAHCMNCKVAWNKEFIVNNLGHTFIVKEYQPFRANVLYERELSLLPEAQTFIENEKRQNDIREEIQRLQVRYTFLVDEGKTIYERELLLLEARGARGPVVNEKLKKEIPEELRRITRRINILTQELNTDTTTVARNTFIRQCPSTDCNGFLSTNLNCSLCGIDACNTCREIKLSNTKHVCNEDIVKSIQLLENDTKECPSCTSLIFRVSGCLHMFCTSCHKSFNWNTLEIENEGGHNPHFEEWVRQNGGNVRSCSRHLTRYSVYGFSNLLEHINVRRVEIDKYMGLLKRMLRIREVTMNTYRTHIRSNLDLRVKFLKKEIDIVQFKTQLRLRDKRQEKYTEMYNILDMYTTCASDLVNILCKPNLNITDFENFKTEIHQLTTYAQNNLLRISKVFKCKEYTL